MQTINTESLSNFYTAPFTWMRETSATMAETQKKYFDTARTAASSIADATFEIGSNNFKISQDLSKALNETVSRTTAEFFSYSRNLAKVYLDVTNGAGGNRFGLIPEAIATSFEKQSAFLEQVTAAYNEAAFRQLNFARVIFNPFSSLYGEWFATYKKFVQEFNERANAFTTSNLKVWSSAVESAANNNFPKETGSGNSPEKKVTREADKRVKESVL